MKSGKHQCLNYFDFAFSLFRDDEGPKYLESNSNYMYENKFNS